MRQIASPLPAGTPPRCPSDHRPHLVETRGAPRSDCMHGAPIPAHWHVECHACAVATVPQTLQELALLHWLGLPERYRIPLDRLPEVRRRLLNATTNATTPGEHRA